MGRGEARVRGRPGEEETGEALEGLGLAAWWLDLGDAVFDVRERAYRTYREQNNRSRAARIAMWLAWDTAAFRGEHPIATGWLQRARRLLDEQPDAPEHAWLARAPVSRRCSTTGPEHAAALAAKASASARRLASDYEWRTRGARIRGVTAGCVAEGLRSSTK